MTDGFANKQVEIDSPIMAGEAVNIASTDHTFTNTTRAIYVGATGNVKVQLAGTGSLTFVGVQAGTLLPVRCLAINKTDTTATSILGLW